MGNGNKPVKTFDLKSVFLIIGGYTIGGYGAEGGIGFEYGADVAEPLVGADGEAVVSRSNNESMIATVTVMESTAGYKNLATLLETQVGEDVISPLSFLMRDDINGDLVKDQYAVFLSRPTPNKGRAASERVFRIFLANAAKTAKFGTGIRL